MKQVFGVFLLFAILMIFGNLVMASAEMNIVKEYDEKGNCVKEMYFDTDGRPIALWGKQYGVKRTAFDEHNNCTEYSYLDINGNPMVITSGYVTVKRTFNSDNKVDTNMYFDIDGQPVKLSLGQYGDKHRYEDGHDMWITYLGIGGEPIRTYTGYTTIKREYGENDKISIEWYYDIDNNPMELRRGQFGTRLVYEDSKIIERVPIDKDGNTIFLLDQYLPQHPWLVVLGAVAVVLACLILPKHWRWGLLVMYLLFILYMTLYVREVLEYAPVSFEVFRSVKYALENGDGYSSWAQIVHNVLLFVPFGFILCSLQSQCSRSRVAAVLMCVLLSVVIELTQHFTGLGWMEIDDVIWNGLGGYIGTGTAWMIQMRKTVSPNGT